jgi:hypothetical protein
MLVIGEDGISPWSSHILTVDITLLVINLLVLFLSIRVTAAAPTVVLKGEVLESRASSSAGGVGITVFLRTELKVSSGIIFVTSDVSVRWNILSGGSSLGNSICVELFDDLAVPHGEASLAEVNWGSEAELLLLSGWNHDTIVVTDVSRGTSTDFSVGDLAQIFDNLVAVTSLLGLGLIIQSLDEFVLIFDGVLSESNSLGVDDSIKEWVSLDVVLIVILVIRIIFNEIFLLDLLVPDGEISNDLSGVGRFLIFGLLFFDSDVDTVGTQVLISQTGWVITISGLHSSEDTWLDLVELSVLKTESLSYVGDRILGNSGKPLSIAIFGDTPSDPRDLFSGEKFLVHKLLLSLNFDLESFIIHVSHSSDECGFVLESGDLREHNWSLFAWIGAFVHDFLPSLIGVRFTSNNPRSVGQLVSSGLDNHE